MGSDRALAETVAAFDLLYGNCTEDDGVLCIVKKTRDRLHGCYKLGRSDYLMEAARAVNGIPGLYFKVAPVDYQALVARASRYNRPVVGGVAEVKSIVAIGLDVDAGKEGYLSRDQALAALRAMPHEPTLVVNTDGHRGGYHAYWALQEPFRITSDADRQNVSEAARRWQGRLKDLAGGKLDATANIDRFLRVIGQQRSPKGARVSTHSYHPDRRFTMRDLWIPLAGPRKPPRATKARLPRPKPSGDIQGPISQWISQTHLGVTDLLLEAGYEHVSGADWKRPGKTTPGRSIRLSTQRQGINVFSSKDPYFDAISDSGKPGCGYSLEAMLVAIRFGGNWQQAAAWCQGQLTTLHLKGGA